MTGLLKRIATALEQRGFWAWFENTTMHDGKGEFPRHGRVFLHAGHERHVARFEWSLGTLRTHAMIDSDPWESEVTASIALPGVALYVSLGSFALLGGLTKRIGHRVARVSVHDGAIWWDTPLADPDVYKSNQPWYVRGSFSLADALLGEEQRVSIPVVKNIAVDVPLPEGTYKGTCSIDLVGVKRPRWFGTMKKMAEVNVPDGVPIPDKGESAHDVEDDAVFSRSTPASSPQQAVGDLVGSVLLTRWKRAGANWRPEKAPQTSAASAPAPHAALA